MKSLIEEINSVQRRIKVTIPAEKVTQAFNSAYARLQKKAKISGFRPGKAPINVIKKLYGGSVTSEVIDDLVNANLFGEISKADIRPVARPVIENLKMPVPETEFEFSALVDVMPKIELVGYKGLEVSVKKLTVDQSTIEKEFEMLARRHAKAREISDVNATAQKGNLVQISHSVSIDGSIQDGMDATDMPINLGANEIHPDIEAAILGMKVGENKTVSITLPEDFNDDELAGKKSEFAIKLNKISTLDLPAIDDEFAKDLNFESKLELENRIRQSLESTVESQNKRELEAALLGSLRSKISFDVPPAMVDEVIDGMISETLKGDKDRTKEAAKNENIRKSFRDEAKLRAQNTLLLWELAKAESIKVDDEDIKTHIKKTLGYADSGAENDGVVSDVLKKVGDRIRENLLLEKAIAFLASSATITELK